MEENSHAPVEPEAVEAETETVGAEPERDSRVFDVLGFTFKEGQEALRELEDRNARRTDPRICICGHSAGSHASHSADEVRRAFANSGRNDCKPSRMECPCVEFVGVLKVGNPRKFVRKTRGIGQLHALGMGIMSSYEAGLEVEWLPGMTDACWRCKTPGARIVPVAITVTGQSSELPQKMNALLCLNCLSDVDPSNVGTGTGMV